MMWFPCFYVLFHQKKKKKKENNDKEKSRKRKNFVYFIAFEWELRSVEKLFLQSTAKIENGNEANRFAKF